MKISPTYIRRALSAALLVVPCVLLAQSPRMILVEEGTNASCGPCAAQNPGFEHYLKLPENESVMVPIIYHANWPGKDVMNAANPRLHDTRVAGYYRMSGVPAVRVNGVTTTGTSGWYNGAPGDSAAISRMAATFRGTTSPISLGFSQTRTGNKIDIGVTVSSTDELKGKKLRIIAVEAYHYYSNAGYNGETDFYYVARKMLPLDDGGLDMVAGVDLSLDAGGSTTVNASYTLDPSWHAEGMYTVAFVQDDATKEVLQVGSNRMKAELHAVGGEAVVMRESSMGRWNAELSSTDGGEFTIKVEKNAPAGWTAGVKVGSDFVTEGKVMVTSNEPKNIEISMTPAESKKRYGEVKVTVLHDRGVFLEKIFRLYGDDIEALIVPKDEGYTEITDAYDRAAAAGELKYAVVAREDDSLFDLNDYGLVVFEAGKHVLYKPDVDRLKSYLDNGGRLFLAGAEIAWGLADPGATGYYQDAAFVRDYLYADYVGDSTSSNASVTVNGVDGDPIGNRMSFSISDGFANQNTPDVLAPRAGAEPIFYYRNGNDSVAGLRVATDKYRLVYLGFGLEGIGNVGARSDVLTRGLQWLLGRTVDVPEEQVVSAAVEAIRPNPVSGVFELPVSLEHGARLSATLYDVRGERVATIADGAYDAGRSVLRFDASALPNGVYSAVVAIDGVPTVRTVTVAR